MRIQGALCAIACLWMANVAGAAEPQEQGRVQLQQVPAMRLDLRPPKVTELFSQATIDRVLRTTRDPDTIEEVEVEGTRPEIPATTPQVWGGIFAPFWALTHPTQAWRILAPIPPDQAAKYEVVPDVTDPYRPAMLPPR